MVSGPIVPKLNRIGCVRVLHRDFCRTAVTTHRSTCTANVVRTTEWTGQRIAGAYQLRTLPILQPLHPPILIHSSQSAIFSHQHPANVTAKLPDFGFCDWLQLNVHATLPFAIASHASEIAACPALYINPPRPITGSSHSLAMAARTRSVHG